MNISKKTSRVRGLKRFAGITRVLAKHGLGDILDRTVFRGKLSNRASKANSVYLSPHRLRLVLEDLGPSFFDTRPNNLHGNLFSSFQLRQMYLRNRCGRKGFLYEIDKYFR